MRKLEQALAERLAEREALQEQIATESAVSVVEQAEDLAAQLVEVLKKHLVVLQKVNMLIEQRRVKGDFDEYVQKLRKNEKSLMV